MSDHVLYEQEGGVVTLTLNEPETRNAISPDIVEVLVGHCDRINRDMSVCCVILTGAGKSFSSGGNIKEMHERTGLFAGSPAEIRRGYQHGIQRIPMAMHDLEVPAIAAVNGHAVGAGCDLSLMCDIRIAADNAEFAESFMRMGLVSGDGGAWFLSRLVGPSRAAEMTFTGEFIKAEEAVRLGIASRVVPLAELMESARSPTGSRRSRRTRCACARSCCARRRRSVCPRIWRWSWACRRSCSTPPTSARPSAPSSRSAGRATRAPEWERFLSDARPSPGRRPGAWQRGCFRSPTR